MSLLSLYVKWRFGDHRGFNEWSLDATKQGSAALGAHIVNLVVAILLSRVAKSKDECAAYLVNFLFNIMASFPLVWIALRASKHFARRLDLESLMNRGFYGDPFRWSFFFAQCAEWTLILCSAKILAALPLFVFSQATVDLGNWILRPLHASPQVELFIVMVIVPCFLNVIQVLVFDNFIRRKAASVRDIGELEFTTEASRLVSPSPSSAYLG